MKVRVLKSVGQIGFRALGSTFEAHDKLAPGFIQKGWVEPVQPNAPQPVEKPEVLILDGMTKKEILKKYNWLDEEDYDKAKKQKTKKELINFVLTTEKLYD